MHKNKTLFLVRHAKSTWSEPRVSDLERQLNERGKRDAPKVGKCLSKCKVKPEIIISSPAVRALRTAEKISKELSYKKSDILVDDYIYTSGAISLFNLIKSIGNSFQNAMLVGHNPSITQLVNNLSNSGFENIPTCGVAIIKFNSGSWSQIGIKTGKLLDYFTPKSL